MVCEICGREIVVGTPFVNQAPTNWSDPSASKRRWFVPSDVEIHGWTPFVTTHPECFARREGRGALDALPVFGQHD